MKIIFSHGKESGPWGTKIEYLAAMAKDLGCSVESIDYQGMDDPDARVQKLVDVAKTETDDYILVGSSMGGYVSIVAAAQLQAKGVFLMAPALYMPGYEDKAYALEQANVAIVHGWNDEIIPWEQSLRFAQQSSCDLYLLESDHRLVDVLEKIGQQFRCLLGRLSDR